MLNCPGGKAGHDKGYGNIFDTALEISGGIKWD